ncbi:heterodimeric methylmalonyl-CoA mutase small subunit [Pontibacter ummariensis]|uniref:Heterodimeric methylmalonyl-CoA mutase small subunit n=2 Tax=Pontibacter ummariensis TaxID=1610492 RepID=A0A239BCV1_9BACT|nr:heterodimeric methylmalonyl-CoA mutase small subunit [Pontibacter ummariensis]SNS05777.1 heterodimeric methylmalonyl-CoA mutase small subunit [Pontibacter ummariensis]
MTDEQQNQQRLFAEFSPASGSEWEQKARKDLRDTPLEQLTWHTYEGIDVKPYYIRQDITNLPFTQQQPGNFPFLRGRKTGNNSWLNVQRIKAVGKGHDAVEKATDALKRGADGIHFVIEDVDLFDLSYLVREVNLKNYPTSYTLQEKPDIFLKQLYDKLKAQQASHRNLKGFLNYDPMTGKGALTKEENKAVASLLDLTKDSSAFCGITVCGTNFSSIGASVVQEVAYTLSAAVAYADRLTTAGEQLESVLRNMQFYMASGTNYFFEIVKLRAIRLLWATIVEAYQAEPELAAWLRIHSTTSSWYETTLDPYVNMLRATTEAMAAAIAGCDSLSVAPFDNTFRPSDEFSERIARNVSVILKEEAYLDKAIDPAAGSYYLESLTNELAQKAWALFKEVEAKGGFEKAYASGFILSSITEVSRRKFKNVATGKDVLVGTNKYPNPNEQLDFDPEELIQSSSFNTTRAAYPTEVMRMATELHLRKRQRRPRAVVAIIGDATQRQVQTTFAQEFFSCAGFETEVQQYESAATAADRLTHAAAEVVVVSASEGAYVKEFAPKLRHHEGKPTIILAEDPQDLKEEMITHGYDEFLFEDCDVNALLKLVHKRLTQEERGNNN